MSALDLEILAGLKMLDPTEKQSLLGVIKSFLNLKHRESPERVQGEQYNRELDEALARVRAGEFYTQRDAEAEAAGW